MQIERKGAYESACVCAFHDFNLLRYYKYLQINFYFVCVLLYEFEQ